MLWRMCAQELGEGYEQQHAGEIVIDFAYPLVTFREWLVDLYCFSESGLRLESAY